MSVLHLKHIEKHLGDLFRELIHLEDGEASTPSQRRSVFLSRALAAFGIKILSGASESDSAHSVIDGFGDNGIDAIYADRSAGMLYIIQSKWHESGKGSIERGELQKFLKGVQDLLQCKFDRFNTKAQLLTDGVDQLLSTMGCRVVLSIIHSGNQELSAIAKRDVEDLVKELNDPTDIVSFEELNQRRIYEALSIALDGSPVSLDVTLQDWGKMDEPYRAFYGKVNAAQICEWWEKYRDRILAKNIRRFLPNTSINKAIIGSLADESASFWYLNNGITLLCERIERKALGMTDRAVGHFVCSGASIVNGAQTVGAIGRAGLDHRAQLNRAFVLARIISLEGCPEDFGRRVTVATNTQNRIHNRDFASLDPEQERICKELRFEDVDYVYKSGVALPSPDKGCTIEEATIALACASEDLRLAVMAKAQLGSLWEDIERAPYRTLFNRSVTGPQVWSAVRVLYIVEHSLATLRGRKGVMRTCAYHANRFLLRQVFRVLGRARRPYEEFDIGQLTEELATKLVAIVETSEDVYPAWIFKNARQCAELEEKISLDEIPAHRWKGEPQAQFAEAVKSHPNFKPQTSLFSDEGDVLM
ncbi:AIPR family protein [Nannocystis pusilla]|uniref:AIPR family protein n=1 Tax=Nannocystis pusilla TaxID=889268 RepID=UPI003BF3B4BC